LKTEHRIRSKMGIKAFVNFHIDGPKQEGKTYVPFKVIRGDVINEYELERDEIEVMDATHYKPDLFKLGFTWTVDNSRTFSSAEVQDEAVIKEYNDGLINLMKQENPNVEEIKVFDHTIRCDTADDMKRAEDLGAVPADAQYRPVALHVHGDYTTESAWVKLKTVLGEEEYDDWIKGHWGIVNIWRPLDFPVERTPLAFIDPTTVKENDWTLKEIHIPGRVGHIKGFLNNPNYRWVMIDQMNTNTVWIFTQFDNEGVIPQVPHSALDVVGTEGCRPRRSIESRMCVKYKK